MADYDVVVIGAGSAGIAASIGAARSGARVCLIEKNGFLGGAATASSVLTYCGFFDYQGQQVVSGVGQELLERLDQEDQYRTHRVALTGNKIVLLDLETLKRVLDEMISESGVTLLLHSLLVDADTENDCITSITVAHRGGVETIRAGAFVDASGDGALIAAAGADQLLSVPAARQASTLVMRVSGIKGSGMHIASEELSRAVERYSDETGVVFPRKGGIDVKTPIVGDHMMLLADRHEDVLDPFQITRAEVEGRQIAWHYLRAFQRYVVGWENAYLLQTGPQIGIRETRRLHGMSIISGSDVIEGIKLPRESIGRGGWPIEDHAIPGEPKYDWVADGGYYSLPYGAITSRSHRNLWAAGRLTSSDPQAFASVRVMGTSFVTGHAAGVAAALSSRLEGGAVTASNVREVLELQGALL